MLGLGRSSCAVPDSLDSLQREQPSLFRMEASVESDLICISGELFSLCSAPAPTSELVRRAKNDILCNVIPDDFGKDIESVATLMAVAFDASIALEQTNVTVAVQDIGYNLTTTTEKAHLTMFRFGVSAAAAVEDLESIFAELYQPGGVDSVALTMLEGVQSTACEMSTKCTGMSERFQDLACATKLALETTQEAIAIRMSEFIQHRNEAASTEGVFGQASESHKTLTRSVVEVNEMLDEAKTRERWVHRRSSWVAFMNDISRMIQPLFGTEASMREAVAKNSRDAKLASRSVNLIATDRLTALERRADALADMVHLVQKIRNLRTQADFAAILIEALYAASGALKRLSTQMLKTGTLWSQMQVQAARLGNPDELGHLVRTACISYPEHDERRSTFWRSTAFKRRAVVYVARWVALGENKFAGFRCSSSAL